MKRLNLSSVMEAANHSKNSAMEAENHVKHGARSKSHTSRGNFLRLVCCAFFAVCIIFNGCNDKDAKIRVTDVDLDEFKTTIEVDETVTVTGKVVPANHTEDKFSVSSSDTNVTTAVANVQGANVSITITGVSPGQSTITLSTSDGAMFSALITVVPKGSGNDDDDEKISTSDFFTIEDATYVTGDLPRGSVTIISDVSISKQTVINGGSTILSFTTSQAVTMVYVSISGVPGYFEYTLPPSTTFTYDIVLLMSQLLTFSDEFTISISVRTGEVVSAPSETETIDVKEVGTGELQVSLSWDQNDDLDLHLLEPDGNHIYYGNITSDTDRDIDFEFELYIVNKFTQHNTSNIAYGDWNALDDYLEDAWFVIYVQLINEHTQYNASNIPYGNWDALEEFIENRSLWDTLWDLEDELFYEEWTAFFSNLEFEGGFLDLDSNAGCWIDEINNENITYTNTPAHGVYYVAVNLWGKCDMSKPGAKYSVTVNYKGQVVSISNNQVGQFAANDGGSRDDTSKYHVIGGFRINAQGITAVNVSSNPFENLNRYSLSSANKRKNTFSRNR